MRTTVEDIINLLGQKEVELFGLRRDNAELIEEVNRLREENARLTAQATPAEQEGNG